MLYFILVITLFIRDRNPFQNLWSRGTGSGTLFSNLGFRPEMVPGTLLNLGLIRVPEPIPEPVPEPVPVPAIYRKMYCVCRMKVCRMKFGTH
jgi:hypothetical protein